MVEGFSCHDEWLALILNFLAANSCFSIENYRTILFQNLTYQSVIVEPVIIAKNLIWNMEPRKNGLYQGKY